MATTRDIVAFLVSKYPHKHELSKARLTKMVYLADWRSALESGQQITGIEWTFNHYGPYVEEPVRSVQGDPHFEVILETNYYGGPKERVRLVSATEWPSLSEGEVAILDFVIEACEPLLWADFMKLVYSTYPVVTQAKYTKLDLPALAARYRTARTELNSG